jgi:hypothetical protein
MEPSAISFDDGDGLAAGAVIQVFEGAEAIRFEVLNSEPQPEHAYGVLV